MPLLETKGAASAQGFGLVTGASAGEPVYIEDVFSTYLYTGTGSTQTITNGIQLGPNWRFGQPSVQSFSNGLLLLPFDTGSTISEKLGGTYSNLPAATQFSDKIFADRNGVTLASPGSTPFRYGSSSVTNGTIEYWAYPTATDGSDLYPSCSINGSSTSGGGYATFVLNGSNTIYGSSTGNAWDITSTLTVAMTAGAWNHVAISWGSNVFRVFINGTLAGSITNSASLGSVVLPLHYSGRPQQAYSNLLISSTQKYTSSFSVPNGPWTYTGIASVATIDPGKGGLVWTKERFGLSQPNVLVDTTRGMNKWLYSNLTNVETLTTGMSPSSNGYTITNLGGQVNYNASTYVSWTFRKQPKFFDVVTWTGNGSNRTIAHNLGSVPGCIFIKRLDTTTAWAVYHRSLANTEYMVLNTTAAKATGTTYWNSTTPTATEFSLGTATEVNANGGTYVAYLFAHNAGGFGLTGADNVISCGSYTTASTSDSPIVNLGYEPQLVIVKQTNTAGDWRMFDNMRGVGTGQIDALLRANAVNAEVNVSNYIEFNATGFQQAANIDTGANTYIYIAIRRGLMKVPTTGTSVFTPTLVSTFSDTQLIAGPPVVDAVLAKQPTASNSWRLQDRLRGRGRVLVTNTTAADAAEEIYRFDQQNGINSVIGSASIEYIHYLFRRAPGFFDVVNVPASGTQSHNLGVVPELIIGKRTDITQNWVVGNVFSGWNNAMYLNLTSGVGSETLWGSGSSNPTATTFYWGGGSSIHYLFASCPGVSKIGTYTGNGTTQTIDCGFTGGARFVLIKRTDGSSDWGVWDTARGIVAGDDRFLRLNLINGEPNGGDAIDPTNSGFIINQVQNPPFNATGTTYLYLAIA